MLEKERAILITTQGLRALNKTILTKIEAYVLWHLVATLPVAGAPISHVQLGKELAVTNVRLGGMLKHLCELGFLIRGVRINLHYHYRINPLFLRIM